MRIYFTKVNTVLLLLLLVHSFKKALVTLRRYLPMVTPDIYPTQHGKNDGPRTAVLHRRL